MCWNAGQGDCKQAFLVINKDINLVIPIDRIVCEGKTNSTVELAHIEWTIGLFDMGITSLILWIVEKLCPVRIIMHNTDNKIDKHFVRTFPYKTVYLFWSEAA